MLALHSESFPIRYAEDDLKDFLEKKYREYNRFEFIEKDPISIPHLFSKKQDIEIMGFWTAMLSWGQRGTILKKCRELLKLMGGEPHNFILNHKESDLKPFLDFKHRTFNAIDALYFIEFFKSYYQKYDSLEDAFLVSNVASVSGSVDPTGTGSGHATAEFGVEQGLNQFRRIFFTGEFPARTIKHVSAPETNSTCKRLNMFLRWMVRTDEFGVDFGIWNQLKPAQLMIPMDLHVERVSRKLNLIERKQSDWKTVLELTKNLAELDPMDPVKYDFALFNLGIEEKF